MSTPTRSPAAEHATRLSGAFLGIIVFLAGIALVGSVFVTARGLFDAPAPIIPASAFATPTPDPSPVAVTSATPGKVTPLTTATTTVSTPVSAAPSATVVIGQSLAQFLQKLLILIVMCIAGSVIASKGIDLFFKSLHAAHGPSAVP